MNRREIGTIKSELILGIFILSSIAILITLSATFKITEKRQIEIEIFNLQKVFYDIEKYNPKGVEELYFLLPSEYYYGFYDPFSKSLIVGVDILRREEIKLGLKKVIIGKEIFFPNIVMFQTVTMGGKPYVLALKREFELEKEMIKKDILFFLPFALVCLVTLTGFAYFLYRRRLFAPLETLKSAYDVVAKGIFNNAIKPIGISEWDMLYEKFNYMLSSLESYKKELEKTISELSKANEALKSAQQEIIFSEKMATVGRLSAGLAHEIGNPLTSIIGFLTFLISNTKDSEEKEILNLMLNETERINRIIKDLLNFARSSSNGEIKICNPKEVVDETIKLLSPQKDFKKITLINNYAENMLVHISKEELKQVLLNLLINAIDASPERGAVVISSWKENGFLVIAVADEGGGVPDEIKDKIFDPFFTTKPPGKGTGLGLSVVHTLISRYGGRVTFENTEKGAIFKVYLRQKED